MKHPDGNKLARRLATPLVLALIGLALVPATAGAALGQSADAGARHCVAQSVPAGTSSAPMQCFSSFSQSIVVATGGRVHLPENVDPATVTPDILNASAISTSSTWYVLSLEWNRSSYTGSSLAWQATAPCGYDTVSNFPSSWNDQMESIALYSGCATTLYWDSNFNGATYAIHVDDSVPDLGQFDLQTSSEKWCATFPCT